MRTALVVGGFVLVFSIFFVMYIVEVSANVKENIEDNVVDVKLNEEKESIEKIYNPSVNVVVPDENYYLYKSKVYDDYKLIPCTKNPSNNQLFYVKCGN